MIFFRIIATVLLFTNVVIKSQTIIDGLAPKHKQKFATLNKIVNYSNFRLELIEKTTIDSIGNFQFSIKNWLILIQISTPYTAEPDLDKEYLKNCILNDLMEQEPDDL